MTPDPAPRVPLRTIAREWGRIGCTGFGGPPAHIALLRVLCVQRRGWLSATEFEDGVAVTSLLPGPASTQLAILCAWRIGGPAGALVGGACFIVPALVIVLALSALFLAASAPAWIRGAAAGAGAAVPAVAAAAAVSLLPASWKRASAPPSAGGGAAAQGEAGPARGARARWAAYLTAGVVVAVLAGPWVVAVLLLSGITELAVRKAGRDRRDGPGAGGRAAPGGGRAGLMLPGGLGCARRGRGGGRRPAEPGLGRGQGRRAVLRRRVRDHPAHAARRRAHLSLDDGRPVPDRRGPRSGHPGPGGRHIAAVGYAAAGVGGGLLAALIAFTPSFVFVLGGAARFDQIRASPAIQAFLAGAGRPRSARSPGPPSRSASR